MYEAENVRILFAPDLDAHFDHFLAILGFGVNPGGLKRRYRREALRLNAKTDAELAVIGITRAEIPAHVMRERFPNFAPAKLRTAQGV